MISVQSLHVYPIKGSQAHDLAEAIVHERGLAHDRRWMLIDATGRFLSQRGHPVLARLRTTLTPTGLIAYAPGMEPLAVSYPSAASRRTVDIWGDLVDAPLAGDAAHAWFSEWLGQPVQLCFMDEAAVRVVDPDYAPQGTEQVSFADGYPLLLTTQVSLADLNTRIQAGPIPTPVPMDRFRPNVVVDGTEAFAEDTWTQIRIGAVRFEVAKPCGRCTVTTIDQHTGARGKEPLRTLNTFRKVGTKVMFGMNLIPLGEGRVRVGDYLEVLR